MEDDKLNRFLREYRRICNKYGFMYSGCGCCGSPYIIKIREEVTEEKLEWDKKDYQKERR